jgi:4-cresol dehydrogenase (hydroxylating) flavoprotein subunit
MSTSVAAVPDAALNAFAAALGDAAVFTSDADLREYRDPFSFASWDDYTAAAVVTPTEVEQVQEVVRIANEHRVPLWTLSQGRNNGYGGPAPRVKGSVIVSLRDMNRVLEINEELAYAVVEPGVRWFDLYDAIKAGGHRLMPSIADVGWGSVIGNTLDHGLTYLPQAQDQAAWCGMEVVLPNGELMRTGMGALPGTKAWHVYKRGLGPTPDPLFMQSNFGIVTRMGYWLQPYPEVYMPCWLRIWNDDALPQVVDTLRALMLDNTIRNVPQIVNIVLVAAVVSRRDQWWDGDGPIPDDVLDKIARELEFGRWMMRFALHEDEAVADLKFDKIKRAFERIEGAEVWGTKCAPEDAAALENPHERVQAGVPSLDLNEMAAWDGGQSGGHVGFSPVAPMTGADAGALRALLRGMVEGAGLDYMAALIATNPRCFVHITLIIFDTEDEAKVRAAYDVAKQLVRECAKRGYGEYRAHLDFMDLAAEQYSWGDHAYRRFNETIKDALYPNGILAPGRHGIWPKDMREQQNGA